MYYQPDYVIMNVIIPEVVLAERLLLGVERAVVAADAVQRLGRRLGHRVRSTLPAI